MDQSDKTPTTTEDFSEIDDNNVCRKIFLRLQMQGKTPEPEFHGKSKSPPEWLLVVMFNADIVMTCKWDTEVEIETEINVDLMKPEDQQLLAEKPLILLLRSTGGKSGKDPDPLTHVENRAGGTADLMPLVFGNDQVRVKVRLLGHDGSEFGCKVKVEATTIGPSLVQNLIPFVMTMVSVHCVPAAAKQDTVYIAALGLDNVLESGKPAVNFSMSLSNAHAQRCLWASACTGGAMLSSAYFAPDDDIYIPQDVDVRTTADCPSFYWNSVKRILVDPEKLKERLNYPLPIEVAGVPRLGKIDALRGRYMGLIDARVLLYPNQHTLVACAKLSTFDEAALPEGCSPLLEAPGTSAKSSARAPLACTDRDGHEPYIVIKLDVSDPIVPEPELKTYFDIMGFAAPEETTPVNELHVEPPPEDPTLDVRRIRKECGALSVHNELSNLACRGLVSMNQGIKRTAANKLITRVRTMLKQFPPGDCSYLEWQETVTGQHAAGRRAITASFRPQPPPLKPAPTHTAARARMAGDQRLASHHIEFNLQVNGKHPRSLLSKALRYLEARTESEASKCVVSAIQSQTCNRYLLWLFGAIEFDKGFDSLEIAKASFAIAMHGYSSDFVANTVGWAALHSLYHYEGNPYAAFVAVKKSRNVTDTPVEDWQNFYKAWVETSGEEEALWDPTIINQDNPFLTTATVFLCLRCYKFTELLLGCLERGCASRGSRLKLQTKITKDVSYLRAASMLLRGYGDRALREVETAIKRFGPSAMLLQMRAVCLLKIRGWDDKCAAALTTAESAGAEVGGALLLEAAVRGMRADPLLALQRAARVHRATPCAQSALVMARVLERCGERGQAERWAAAAVRLEPLLADGWAVLALLAMAEREVSRARHLLRTARQVGPIDEDIERQLTKMMKVIKIDTLADSLTNNLCLCDYFDASSSLPEDF